MSNNIGRELYNSVVKETFVSNNIGRELGV